MKKNIEKCKDLFESISCLCCEGPEFMTRMELMSAIGKDAGKGYDICKRYLIAHAADKKHRCHVCNVAVGEYHKHYCSVGVGIFCR